MLERFFARWRAFSERLVRAMLVAFGALCIAGALQVQRMGGAPAFTFLFALSGVALIASAYVRPRKSAKL